MRPIRLESVVAFVVSALLLLGCGLAVQSALAFHARQTVRGVVGRISEGRDGQGVPYSKADVEWTDAAGRPQTFAITDQDRFAFTAGQIIELKVDPDDPTQVSRAGVEGRVYVAIVFAGLGLYVFFVAVRSHRRTPRRRPVSPPPA